MCDSLKCWFNHLLLYYSPSKLKRLYRQSNKCPKWKLTELASSTLGEWGQSCCTTLFRSTTMFCVTENIPQNIPPFSLHYAKYCQSHKTLLIWLWRMFMCSPRGSKLQNGIVLPYNHFRILLSLQSITKFRSMTMLCGIDNILWNIPQNTVSLKEHCYDFK